MKKRKRNERSAQRSVVDLLMKPGKMREDLESVGQGAMKHDHESVMERRRREDARRSPHFDLELRLRDIESLRETCQKDLRALFEVIFEAENLKKAKMAPQNAALNTLSPDNPHAEFFKKLTELCGTTPSGQSTVNFLRSMGGQKNNKEE